VETLAQRVILRAVRRHITEKPKSHIRSVQDNLNHYYREKIVPLPEHLMLTALSS
jgi:hypothetical protein